MQARVAWELGGDLGLLRVSLTNREVDTVLPDLVDSRSQTKEIMDFFFFLASQNPLYPFHRNTEYELLFIH